MINGEEQLNDLIWDKLQGITVNVAPTGQPEVLQPVFMAISIPEEEAVKSPRIPGIAIHYLYDLPAPEGRGPRDGRDLLVAAHDDVTGDITGYLRYQNITRRHFYYQIDIYTYSSKQLIYLAQRVLARLRPRLAALTDADDNVVYYHLHDVEDMTREIDDERLFRRSLIYCFDAWVISDEDRNNPEQVGMVEYIKIEVRDKASDDVLDTEWVPEEPPA